jgi:hypothetical protein
MCICRRALSRASFVGVRALRRVLHLAALRLTTALYHPRVRALWRLMMPTQVGGRSRTQGGGAGKLQGVREEDRATDKHDLRCPAPAHTPDFELSVRCETASSCATTPVPSGWRRRSRRCESRNAMGGTVTSLACLRLPLTSLCASSQVRAIIADHMPRCVREVSAPFTTPCVRAPWPKFLTNQGRAARAVPSAASRPQYGTLRCLRRPGDWAPADAPDVATALAVLARVRYRAMIRRR